MILLFFLGDLLVILAHIFWRDEIGFFDIDKEGNLASLYTGGKLWIVATLAMLQSTIIVRLHTSRKIVAAWILFALGIAYIGLDDMIGIHERIGFVLNNRLGTGGFYGESFNWLLYFSPFIVAALLVFGVLIHTLFKQHRRAAWWLLAGALLWTGSIGVELIGRNMILAVTVNVPRYHLLIILEEALELVGATFIAWALWRTLRDTVRQHVRVVKE